MPSETPASPVTACLRAWERGDPQAFDALVRQVHAQLRGMARARLRGSETPSLAEGDLLHEALIKLMQSKPAWQDRGHFFSGAALAMRSVLVDHARARRAAKRGGALQRVTYTVSEHGEDSMVADLLTLDALLNRLAQADPRAAEVLQLTYFGGLSRAEIATVLGLSVPTIDRELRFARAWLTTQLQRSLEV